MTDRYYIWKKEEENVIEAWGDDSRGTKKIDRALGSFFLRSILRFGYLI